MVIAVAPPPVKTRSAVPGLLRVIVCAALVESTIRSPKVMLGTDTLIPGAVPTPLSATVWGLPVAS
jgi:hypothetical protein